MPDAPNPHQKMDAALEEMRRRMDELRSSPGSAFDRADAPHDEVERAGADAAHAYAREALGLAPDGAGADLARLLNDAHLEALRVGDSPLRADLLADKLPALTHAVGESGLIEETQNRLRAALADAERVLRRDDDGREAARHLQAALRLVEKRPRAASPFLDDD